MVVLYVVTSISNTYEFRSRVCPGVSSPRASLASSVSDLPIKAVEFPSLLLLLTTLRPMDAGRHRWRRRRDSKRVRRASDVGTSVVASDAGGGCAPRGRVAK